MKTNYDLIFSTPTYHSVGERLSKYYLPTLSYLGCDVLSVIVSMCPEDTAQLIPIVNTAQGADVVLFETDSKFLVPAIDWTPLWVRSNNISAKYYTMMPDNNQFLQNISNTTVDLLDADFDKTNFCVATFYDGIHFYKGWGKSGVIDGHIEINPCWIDNPHFIPWKDVFAFGLLDGPVDFPCPLFFDMEYVHRAKILSGRPVIIDTLNADPGQYIHHHDIDAVTASRSNNSTERINAGINFWVTKYGLPSTTVWDNPSVKFWEIYDAVSQPEYADRMKRHISFNNIWDDYDAIYILLKPKFRLITSNCHAV